MPIQLMCLRATKQGIGLGKERTFKLAAFCFFRNENPPEEI